MTALAAPEPLEPPRRLHPTRIPIGTAVVQLSGEFESYETYDHAWAPTSNDAGVTITEFKNGRIVQVVIHSPGTYKTVSWSPNRH